MKKHNLIALFLALTFVVSLFATTVQAADVPQPIAFYHFDDAGNPGKDATKNGNDLAAKGEVTVEKEGKTGGCVYFDGKSVLAAVPGADKLEFIDKLDDTTKKFSLVFWFKQTADDIIGATDSSQRFRVFTGGNTGLATSGQGGICVVLRPDSLLFPTVIYNDAQCDFPGEYGHQNIVGQEYEFVDDQWIHIALTVDATTNTTTYYVNGEQVSNKTTEKDVNFKLSNTDMWYAFGGNYMVDANGGEVFNQCYIGKVDEAGIFDTVLTADQVKYYMNNGYNPAADNSGSQDTSGSDTAPDTADGTATAFVLTAMLAGAATVICKKKKIF